MIKNSKQIQEVTRRSPQQSRSRNKVELIFEATIMLLEMQEITTINTNTIAKLAGISIGTLYQYFPDKNSVFQALAEHEFKELSEKIRSVMRLPPTRPGMRVIAVMDAVLDAYRGKQLAHQRLLRYSMEQGGTGLQELLFDDLCASFEEEGLNGPTIRHVKLSREEAFVLTRAIAGVLRDAIGKIADGSLRRQELESALIRLIVNYFSRDDDPDK